MIGRGRIPLVVEIMEQGDDAPSLLVLAEFARVAADRRFDRERVLAQALALRPLSEQRPGRVAGNNGVGGYRSVLEK
jgi:hypothetical protein